MNKARVEKTAASILEINQEVFPWFLALYLIVLVSNQVPAGSILINVSPNYLLGICIISGILFSIKKSPSKEIESVKLDIFFAIFLALISTLLIFLILPNDNLLNLRIALINLAVSLIFLFIIEDKSG
jgi:hypothetical protein